MHTLSLYVPYITIFCSSALDLTQLYAMYTYMYIYKNKQNHICVGVSSWYVCILVDFVASRIGNFCWILHLEFVLLPSWSYRWSSNDCLLTAHVNQRLKLLVYSFFLIILQCPEQPRYHQDLIIISYIPNVGKIPPQHSSGKSSKSKGFCDRHWCCGM